MIKPCVTESNTKSQLTYRQLKTLPIQFFKGLINLVTPRSYVPFIKATDHDQNLHPNPY